MEYFAVALAWLIPGAGHFMIGQRGRGVVFAIVIHLLFAAGIFIGGFNILSPKDPNQMVWGYTQYAAGWPMLAGYRFKQAHPDAPASYGKVEDIGTVYCGIAGMLNLLVIFDVLVRASSLTPKAAPAGGPR